MCLKGHFLLGKDSTFLVTPYLGMAKVYSADGKATKAIKMYQHAITLLESSRGAESKDLVVPLLGLGSLLLKEGRAVDAEAHFTRFIIIFSIPFSLHQWRCPLAYSLYFFVFFFPSLLKSFEHIYIIIWTK